MKRLQPQWGAAVFIAAVLGVPLSAMADDQLDRFEEISEQSHEITMRLMIREYSAMGADEDDLRAAIPDGEWNDAYREAGRCMLDGYAEIIGSSGVDRMLDEMEALFKSMDNGAATFESMQELSELNTIKGVSTEQQMAITQECGFVDLSMQRMRDSGFMDVIQSQIMQGEGG